MNYQYIEQLIGRYFEAQTTLQEEQILRSFFAGDDVPGHLMQYAELFQYEADAKNEALGTDFDQRMLSLVEAEPHTTAFHPSTPRKESWRGLPFFRAAAVVAIVLTIGRAADHAISTQSKEDSQGVTAISPYIRQADIPGAVRRGDISRAEAKPQADSLLTQPISDAIQ